MNEDLDSSSNNEGAISFTARLIAFHRYLETQRKSPLINDPYAKLLAGDLSDYVKKHRYSSFRGDYSIVRSYFVESQLLTPWCSNKSESQIVLMGAGLDTRAYRFEPLSKGKHTVFELDFASIIEYKKTRLGNEDPICEVKHIPVDISNPTWHMKLEQAGYSDSIPTFWSFEGVLYYLKKSTASSILETAAGKSEKNSDVFADVCVPGIAQARFGPFLKHFQWGLDIGEVPKFFDMSGWSVSSDWADAHDTGRDVGQKGFIFAYGNLSQ